MTERTQPPPKVTADAVREIPPELRRAVQALCDTYDSLDLRLETTLFAAEEDVLAALPEVENCKADLRRLISLLIRDLRHGTDGSQSQRVLLRLSFQDEADLTQQLLSHFEAEGIYP